MSSTKLLAGAMKMTSANEDLRAEARAAYIPFWKIAEVLNISEATMTRKLRRELPPEEKAHIRAIIEQLKIETGREGAGH